MSIDNAVLISGCLIGARELLIDFGADADAVALHACLPARVFEDPELYVPAGSIVDYLELAAVASHREDFGLLHACRLPLAVLGPGWMVMRAAETVGEALLDFVRLYGVYTDAGSLRAERNGDALWLESSFLPVGRFGSTQTVNLTLGTLCQFVRSNLKRRWMPHRVELRQTPTDHRKFIEFFGPGVKFGCDRDAILVDHQTLSSRMGEGPDRQVVHHALLLQTAGHGVAIVAQVKALLSALLRSNTGAIDTVCEALVITPRTLQRRLAAAGTSYRALVDEVRADLAERNVKRSSLSLQRIADLLGYSNQAAFSRAYRRWHGTNPRSERGSVNSSKN
jgi:AraC-like DNA-binding protein